MGTVHEAFADLHATTREALSRLADEWAAGHLSPGMFTVAVDEVLLEAHTQAVVIGRTHAGDTAPQETDDRRFAETILEDEREYLRGFRRDLDEGRYTAEDGERDGEAVRRRAESYATRTVGSANEAMFLTLPQDTLVYWITGGAEAHCEDCPEMEQASPWILAEMPFHVGQNATACLTNCLCSERTADGLAGFSLPG